MMQRSTLVLAATGLAIGALCAASGPATGSAHSSKLSGPPVIEKNNTHKYIDLAKGAVGDEYLFTSKLYSNSTMSKDRVQIGNDAGVCTQISKKASQCQVTVVAFGSGQISVQGIVPNTANVFTLPVTGGSGELEGVSGEVTVTNVSNSKARLNFDLIFPTMP